MKNSWSVFGPGIRLMRSLRVATKMGLMGLLLLVPLVLLLVGAYRSAQHDRQIAADESQGVRLVRAATELIDQLQAHRGLTNRSLSGDAAATDKLAARRAELVAAIRRLDERVAATDGFVIDDAWRERRERINALAEGRHANRRDEAFAEHSAAVEQVRQLLLLTAERSGLLLDPEAGTFFLMDIGVERMVPLRESIGLTRGQGAAILVRGDASNTERVQMLGRIDVLQRQLSDLRGKFEALARAGATPPPGWEKTLADAQAFGRHVIEVFSADVLQGDPAAFFARGDATLAALSALDQQVLDALESALDTRRAQRTERMVIELSVSALGVLLVLYLAASFYFSFSGAFSALTKGVRQVAAGNLEHRVEIRGSDELAEIGSDLEAMNGKLSAMVAEIRSSAVRVGQAGQQVATGSQALSQRTDEQAASLRQTVATVSQLSAAVASNADAAQELDRMAGDLRLQAEAGGTAMRETVDSMTALETSSRRVGEIVGVIDALSFQTNILALNAAVEAARAGEAGRGFAVVATEVRQLAQRSGAAAREIRTLIGESTEQVGASVQRIENVSGTLGALVTGVQDVSQRLRGIATASAEQSQGLREMSQNVGNLDEITRQNAAMVEESTTASHELVERAQMLSSAVSSIRLRQGSADEARELVERASALVAQVGWEAAARTMRDRGQGFTDRDLYVFAVDRSGSYRLHAAKPQNEGKRVHDIPGIDGDRFVDDAWSRTERGASWIEYDILNLETGAVQPKASYMKRIDERLVLGCGVYRTAADAGAAAAPRATASASAPRQGAPRLAAA